MKVTKRIDKNGPDVYSWRQMIKGTLIVIGSFAGFYALMMFFTGGIFK
jgi:hypothetical protein